MMDNEVVMQLTFDPLAERAKAIRELCDAKCDTAEVHSLVVDAICILVESMKVPPQEETDNVTQLHPIN